MVNEQMIDFIGSDLHGIRHLEALQKSLQENTSQNWLDREYWIPRFDRITDWKNLLQNFHFISWIPGRCNHSGRNFLFFWITQLPLHSTGQQNHQKIRTVMRTRRRFRWYCTLKATAFLPGSLLSFHHSDWDEWFPLCLIFWHPALWYTKPWFCEVISHRPLIKFFTGWFIPPVTVEHFIGSDPTCFCQ